MSTREIATTIKLDGEKAFNAALREAQRELRVMGADLKAAAAEFEFTGDKQQLLTAKSRTLRDEIAQQDKIVEALTQAVKDSAEKYGDASKQTDGYRIKLSNATTTLFKLKQQLAETDREAEELGRDSTRVGRQIKDGIGDAAEDAGESLDDMIKKISSDVGSLKSSAAFSIATNIASFAAGSIGQINDFVENTRDYRNKRALAKSAAEEALNLTEEEYNNLFKRIVGITNDPDGATEGIITLMKSGVKTYQEVLTLADIMLGLYIQFGEEARFEDVMESFQETYATGKMVGKFQELAERQGIDPEMVNKAMESAIQEDRVQILANAFAGKNGMQSLHNYREKNAPLIRENESVAELEIAQAELAEAAAPLTTTVNEIRTGLTQMATGLATLFAYPATPNTNTEIPTMQEITKAFLSGGDEAVQSLVDSLSMSDEDKSELIDMLKELGMASGQSYDSGMQESMKNAFDNMPKLFEQGGKDGGTAYIDGFSKGIDSSWDTALTLMRKRLDSEGLQIEDIKNLNEMQKDASSKLGGIGASAGAEFDKEINTQLSSAAPNAAISGANVGTALKNGFDSTMPLAVAANQAYVGQMLDAYASLSAGLNARVVSPRVPGQPAKVGTPANGAGNTTAVFMVNDREFARGILPAINSMQGRSVTRMQTII